MDRNRTGVYSSSRENNIRSDHAVADLYTCDGVSKFECPGSLGPSTGIVLVSWNRFVERVVNFWRFEMEILQDAVSNRSKIRDPRNVTFVRIYVVIVIKITFERRRVYSGQKIK